MDLLCNCVSTDCTNCPRYKNWLEGKNPDAKRPQEETDEQRMVGMRASEDIQKLMTVAHQTGKSEMMVLPAPSFGPKHRPCVCSLSEFRKLCQIEEKSVADLFFESLSNKGWNLHFFRQQHKWLKDGELEYLYPVLYNWICNHRGSYFDDIITKYNDFARSVGLKVFKKGDE